jgi:hypothetical protein
VKTCHDVGMNRARTILATLLLLAALAACKATGTAPDAAAVAVTGTGTSATAAHASPPATTLTVTAAAATVYGAQATEVVIGAPMPLSGITDLVVVAIAPTSDGGSCEIRAAGVRVAYASAPAGSAAACIWRPGR